MYKIENGKLLIGSKLIATASVSCEIQDPHGHRIGNLDVHGNVRDSRGKLVGSILGSGVFDQQSHRPTSIRDIKKTIETQWDPITIAVWLLCVKTAS